MGYGGRRCREEERETEIEMRRPGTFTDRVRGIGYGGGGERGVREEGRIIRYIQALSCLLSWLPEGSLSHRY